MTDTGKPREFISHVIPLGGNEFAQLSLPRDLTAEEADRLCGVIKALAFTEPSPSGSADA